MIRRWRLIAAPTTSFQLKFYKLVRVLAFLYEGGVAQAATEGERQKRCRGQEERLERVAVVDKIED